MNLRLDKALVERGLVPTRTRAQQRISAGQVSVDGNIVSRPGLLVNPDQRIETHGPDLPYVSRGGSKLVAALDAWNIDLSRRICLDVGISTGGFTDCMLQRGADRVIGIDTGHGQLARSLQGDPRLHLMERTNARYLTASLLPDGITFFTMDVSFIAASLVLPAVIVSAFPAPVGSRPEGAFAEKLEAVILVKPQFEAGREFVGRHGIVRNQAAHQHAIARVMDTVKAHGAKQAEVMDSPIDGGSGNREFLMYARF